MHTVSRLGYVAKTIIQQPTCERLVGARFASRKKREDCLDQKKESVKETKKEVKSQEACVDLNFKKKELNIYDYDDCLPPKRSLDKNCSTVKAKKVSCTSKKRQVPTGCRKFSMYSDIQNSFQQGHKCGYKEAGFDRKIFSEGSETGYLYHTKNRCECADPTSKIAKNCSAPLPLPRNMNEKIKTN